VSLGEESSAKVKCPSGVRLVMRIVECGSSISHLEFTIHQASLASFKLASVKTRRC